MWPRRRHPNAQEDAGISLRRNFFQSSLSDGCSGSIYQLQRTLQCSSAAARGTASPTECCLHCSCAQAARLLVSSQARLTHASKEG